MPDLDDELANLRDSLRETVRQPDLGAVLEQSRQRTSRRRLQFGAVAAVLVVGAAIPVLRTSLQPVPENVPATAGATTETTQFEPIPADPNAMTPFIYDIGFADERHGFALRAACTPTTAAVCISELLITTDGEHWENRRLPTGFAQTEGGGVSASLFVFGHRQLAVGDVFPHGTPRFYSADAGLTWQQVSPEFEENLAAIPDGGSLQYVCMSQNECEPKLIVMLPDSGRAATLATPPPLANPIPAANRKVDGGWWVSGKDPATGQGAVAVSRDEGRSWRLAVLPNSPGTSFGITVTARDNTVYATGSGQLPDVKNGLLAVYRSTDGGTTWEQTWRETLGKEPRSIGGTVAATDGSLIINTELGHPYSSKDGGKTFEAINDVTRIGSIRQTGAGYLLSPAVSGSEPYVYRLSADGVHWKELSIK